MGCFDVRLGRVLCEFVGGRLCGFVVTPDSFFNNGNSFTFLFSPVLGLVVEDGDVTHAELVDMLVDSVGEGGVDEEVAAGVEELSRWYWGNGRSVSSDRFLFGRVGFAVDLGDWFGGDRFLGEGLFGELRGEGASIICFWGDDSVYFDGCVRDVLGEFDLGEFVYVSSPKRGLVRVRGGVGGGGGGKIGDRLRGAGLLGPGQKWWSLYGDGLVRGGAICEGEMQMI